MATRTDTYTVGLGDADGVGPDLLGGKGTGLVRLAEAGFPVPHGFIVTTDAYDELVAASGLSGSTPDEMRRRIPVTSLPQSISAAIRDAYARLGAPSVAVRSSGTSEDLPGASFAGQHDTFLKVEGEQAVLAAVQHCWASLWTPRAVAYRQRYGRDEHRLSLAVVVQTMVDAQWAGVMFTCDPVTGRRDRVVVEAVSGLGESLVSGEASGQRHVVDKPTGRVVEAAAVALPDGVLGELARLGGRAEDVFGSPQDIEWAYDGAHLSLVQARPLTALPEEPPPSADPAARAAAAPRRRHGRFIRKAAGQAADHLPYPPFPIDLSLIYRPTVAAILQALRSVGFVTPQVDEVLVEVDEGVVQGVLPRLRPTRQAAVRLPARVPGLVRMLREDPLAWQERAGASLDSLIRGIDQEDLSTLSEAELLDRVETLRQALGRYAPARFGRAPRGLLADLLLRSLLRLAAGNRAPDLHTDLLANIPSVTRSANEELQDLARKVRAEPRLQAIYHEAEPAQIPQRLQTVPAGRALLGDVQDFLHRYGYRETSIPTVGLPSFRDDPRIVHGLLKGLAAHGPDTESTGADSEVPGTDPVARAREQLLRARTPGRRRLGALALRPLEDARALFTFREDSHYSLFAALAVIRRVVLELGGRLAARDVLESADDIVFLEHTEIGRLAPEQARAAVQRRRAARDRALPGYMFLPVEDTHPASSAEAVRGTPAARGSVVGRVRIVRGEHQFSRLQRGDVLVCPYTNPTWTPLFSLASGVVVDGGGAASHAAIVAREYGIPAVMGTGNATKLLRDGQRVRVDGGKGTITFLEDAAVGADRR